jgi:flagellar biosynthesis GTPase FlhF
MREPKLGVAVGRKGVGKTYTTTKLIDSYVVGNPAKGVKPRKVLILDVNDEFKT